MRSDTTLCRHCAYRKSLGGGHCYSINETYCDSFFEVGAWANIANKDLADPRDCALYKPRKGHPGKEQLLGESFSPPPEAPAPGVSPKKSKTAAGSPAPRKRYTPKKRRVARLDYRGRIITIYDSADEAAQKTGVSRACAYKCCNDLEFRRRRQAMGKPAFRYLTADDVLGLTKWGPNNNDK